MNRFAAALALAIIIPATAVPASANGQFSFHVAPTNSQEDRAMRTGLALYQMYRDVRGGASIIQNGRNNSAGVAQDGRDNLGIVSQRGNGHNGTVSQTGNGNSYGLFQFGRGTSGQIVQTGSNRTGATFQWGW
ncbi:curlin [Aliihoeflea sp. PC F10.4]